MATYYSSCAALLLALAQAVGAQGQVPSDISEFVERRDLCDHLRGEITAPGQDDEQTRLIDDINRQCQGTDAALHRLKLKYADSTPFSHLLNQYEADIESR